jgi:hypothetical protein
LPCYVNRKGPKGWKNGILEKWNNGSLGNLIPTIPVFRRSIIPTHMMISFKNCLK